MPSCPPSPLAGVDVALTNGISSFPPEERVSISVQRQLQSCSECGWVSKLHLYTEFFGTEDLQELITGELCLHCKRHVVISPPAEALKAMGQNTQRLSRQSPSVVKL
ncbi:hypothetical protein ILYODFUR_033579 [Ilyodon furcidens]|uniref:Uncharacterized protein n=1 Tax=Ilyodon furcidens TaxID=33524 RepID=A0ABV0ULM2_9TELE